MTRKKSDKVSAAQSPPKKEAKKNSLVANINRRKKAGTNRSKKDSTISDSAYSDMQKDWPKKGKPKQG